MKTKLISLLTCSACITCFTAPIASAQIVDAEVLVTLLEAPTQSTFNVGDEYTMYLSYDSRAINGSGVEFISEDQITSLKFFFGDTEYGKSYDAATGYPRLHLLDAELTGIDFLNSNGIVGGNDSSFFSFLPDQTFNYSVFGESEYAGTYSIVTVPETSTCTLLGGALWMLLFKRNRR